MSIRLRYMHSHETIDEETAIRDLVRTLERKSQTSSTQTLRSDRKICAKFSDGIRWGIGLSLERTCGSECKKCSGDTFSRKCRFFTFVPHYEVVLRSTSGSDKVCLHFSQRRDLLIIV
jgi:nucleotidyltransferase/DNA polymerase involved in DNA repair